MFLDFLFGKGERTQQIPRFTPQQQDVLSQLTSGAQQQLPQGFQYLQNLLSQDPEAMKAFEAPARRAFSEQTLPTIAERFSSMDAQRSSAFGQQLGQAGAALEENLAAQRAGLQGQGLNQLLSLLQTGLTPQNETMVRPGTSGLLGGLGKAAGTGLGFAGGLYGASQLGPLINSLLAMLTPQGANR
jgi:hypothetical protein